jgi:hypothetical protein
MNLIHRINENNQLLNINQIILHNKKTFLKKIVNVYQINYKNSESMGIGDYLRGCFCLFQICKLIGIEFDMDLSNHPISKYIYCDDNYEEKINYDEICKYEDPNFIFENGIFKNNSNHFLIKFLNFLHSKNLENNYIFCNSFPILKIDDESKEFIKSKIKPKEEILIKLDYVIKNLKLIKGNYGIIHIRFGDEYLFDNNKSININKINRLLSIIKKNIHPKKKYLLISDNNNIKFLLTKYFSNIVFKVNKISHLAYTNDEDSILETLVDFFLITHSNYVLSFSPYPWGTGFSKWPSIIFNIPYYNFKL